MERKLLLERTKIGEFLSMEVVLANEDIDLYLYSVDISSNCVFKRGEWQKFVENINRINQQFQKIPKIED